MNNEVRIVLAPIKPDNLPKPFKGEGATLLSRNLLEKVFLEEKEIYVVVLMEESLLN